MDMKSAFQWLIQQKTRLAGRGSIGSFVGSRHGRAGAGSRLFGQGPQTGSCRREPGRGALANSRGHFFFLPACRTCLISSPCQACCQLFCSFLGSASFFLSFLSEDFESAEAAADFFAGDAFLSFKSLLAFEALPSLFFSSLATLTTSRSVPVLAQCLWNFPEADR